MPEDFEREHLSVLAEANVIYVKRSKTRGQRWLDTSIKRELDMVEEKLARAKAALDNGLDDPEIMEEFQDSLIDIMNFSAFAIRKARRGMRA